MSKKNDKKDEEGRRRDDAGVRPSRSPRTRAPRPASAAPARAPRSIAFVLVLALNLVGDQTAFDAVWRALLAGIVVNVIVWRCAIVVWRHIVISELRAGEERRDRAHARAPGAAREARAAEQAAEPPAFRAA